MAAERWDVLERLLEKPLRLFIGGEGGCGKTHVISKIIIGGAFRFFLSEFFTKQLVAFTNRAAKELGDDADTISGFASIPFLGAAHSAKSGKRVASWTSGGVDGALIGAAGNPGAALRNQERMKDLGLVGLDEASQCTPENFDAVNEKVFKGRQGRDGVADLAHWLLPFAMLMIVIIMGDPMQLVMPQSHSVFEWTRMFRRLIPAKHSSKRLAELITGKQKRSGDDRTWLERIKSGNMYRPGATLPNNAPRASDDPDAPPTVSAMEMLARSDEYPVDNDPDSLGTSARRGFEAFARIQDMVVLTELKRFMDNDGPPLSGADGKPLPVRALRTVNPKAPLPRLLGFMRDSRFAVDGKEIPRALFNAVLGPRRCTPTVLRTPGSFPTDGTVTIAHQWEFITPLNLASAQTAAAAAGQMLFYVAATDAEKKGPTLTRAERLHLRYTANSNHTGGRVGLLALFEGMEVEITEKYSKSANLLKSARGTVERVVFDPNENLRFAEDGSEARRRGYAALEYVPSLLLRVDGYTQGTVPERPDLLLVVPGKSRVFPWSWKSSPNPQKTQVQRYQLPVIQTAASTPYTAQGMTAEWALLHLQRHDNMTYQDHFYQAYVSLSRPRHHLRLGHHGPVPDELPRVLALGPEPHIRMELARQKKLSDATREHKVFAASRLMGWPATATEREQWRRDHAPAGPAPPPRGDAPPLPAHEAAAAAAGIDEEVARRVDEWKAALQAENPLTVQVIPVEREAAERARVLEEVRRDPRFAPATAPAAQPPPASPAAKAGPAPGRHDAAAGPQPPASPVVETPARVPDAAEPLAPEKGRGGRDAAPPGAGAAAEAPSPPPLPAVTGPRGIGNPTLSTCYRRTR